MVDFRVNNEKSLPQLGGPTLFLSVDFVNILPKEGVDRH